MSLPPWRDTTIVAYLDEPPFAISGRARERPSACDMDVALHILTRAGVGDIRYVRTTFHELIPGLLDQRWHLTTAIFVTDDRAEFVDFSRPIWAMTDGFIVRRHDAARMTSYEAIAAAHATLAVVVGQVQRETAIGAGVPTDRIVEFPDQEAALRPFEGGRWTLRRAPPLATGRSSSGRTTRRLRPLRPRLGRPERQSAPSPSANTCQT